MKNKKVKLRRCRKCGTQYRKSLDVCPECSAKYTRPLYMRWYMFIVYALVLAGALYVSFQPLERGLEYKYQAQDRATKYQNEDFYSKARIFEEMTNEENHYTTKEAQYAIENLEKSDSEVARNAVKQYRKDGMTDDAIREKLTKEGFPFESIWSAFGKGEPETANAEPASPVEAESVVQ